VLFITAVKEFAEDLVRYLKMNGWLEKLTLCSFLTRVSIDPMQNSTQNGAKSWSETNSWEGHGAMSMWAICFELKVVKTFPLIWC
jgi:hypothetical protein